MPGYIPIIKRLNSAPPVALLGVYSQEDRPIWWMTMLALDHLLDNSRYNQGLHKLRADEVMTAKVTLRQLREYLEDGPCLLLWRDLYNPMHYTLRRRGNVVCCLETTAISALFGSDFHQNIYPGDATSVSLDMRIGRPLYEILRRGLPMSRNHEKVPSEYGR
jgi:hypothetical protein